MSMTKLTELTPQQEFLVAVYRSKWKGVALATEPIDRYAAAKVVKTVYTTLGLAQPEVLFCESPYHALYLILSLGKSRQEKLGTHQREPLQVQLMRKIKSQLWQQLEKRLYSYLHQHLEAKLHRQLSNQLGTHLETELYYQLYSQFESQRGNQLWNQIFTPLHPNNIVPCLSFFDFCQSILNCQYDNLLEWEALKSLMIHCGWIFPYEKFCFVCDRPSQIIFDAQNRLHAEGNAAIEFRDGFNLYFYQGIRLPRKYGIIPPNQWQATWLLNEDNSELRQLLIQRIGYKRIAQELSAIEMDCWAEYTLLKIEDGDVEPMHLLRMTCPSTGHLHVLRVPPHIQSAEEAIRWVNWGIHPQDFAMQT